MENNLALSRNGHSVRGLRSSFYRRSVSVLFPCEIRPVSWTRAAVRESESASNHLRGLSFFFSVTFSYVFVLKRRVLASFQRAPATSSSLHFVPLELDQFFNAIKTSANDRGIIQTNAFSGDCSQTQERKSGFRRFASMSLLNSKERTRGSILVRLSRKSSIETSLIESTLNLYLGKHSLFQFAFSFRA